MTINNDTFKELFVIFGIVLAIGYVVFAPSEDELSTTKVPSMEEFDDHPIVAWLAYDGKGGPCVRVRYDVIRAKTKLYMFAENGKLVHQTPLSLSPFRDGRRRTETYVWKLYRTEWSSQIESGYYTIVVGTEYDKRGLGTEVEVL